jgi:hypothetical protein
MKRFAAAIVVAAGCAAILSTDAAAQADTPPEHEIYPVLLRHHGMMMCDDM